MTRLIAATVFLCLFSTIADARPRQARHDSAVASQCIYDNTARIVCPGTAGRIQRHARVSTGFVSGSLVDRARRYLGTNPTGKRSLWCGRFMALIAPALAAKVRNPDMARDWAVLQRVSPQVGAIAVMSRGKRGGHVGVVTGFDANGNPIVVSGNHNNTVGEGVYPRSRVIAYVGES